MHVDHRLALKKRELAGALERVCQALELTGAQEKRAEGQYTAVGEWLAGSDDPMLQGVAIYVQGSTALGTTVRPFGRDEHDVDLVCFVPELGSYMPPAFLRACIGDRLRQNGRYGAMLEEKPRCWRLNYAGEFHMDITPAITNPACDRGGELVPDKKLRAWKPTNPRGYRALFEARAKLQPRMRLFKGGLAEDRSAQANVEPYPSPMATKGVLRWAVQLAKCNRDVHFAKSDPGLAPISVIITTLAARSYAGTGRARCPDRGSLGRAGQRAPDHHAIGWAHSRSGGRVARAAQHFLRRLTARDALRPTAPADRRAAVLRSQARPNRRLGLGQPARGTARLGLRGTAHTAQPLIRWLLLGSGVVSSSRNQAGDEGAQQGFATSASVVYELEEAERERQLVLRDAPMRAQPGAQQRPETFDRVDVHLTKAVPVLVAGILTASMTDRLVPVAPGWQARVDAILVRVDEGVLRDCGLDESYA